MSSPVIRSAVPEDIAEIRQLIVELAVYEKEPDAVKLTEEKLANDVFAEHPTVLCTSPKRLRVRVIESTASPCGS